MNEQSIASPIEEGRRGVIVARTAAAWEHRATGIIPRPEQPSVPKPTKPTAIHHRRGSVDDLDAVMALLDAAVDWLVARGQPEQWGTQPWSADPVKVRRMREMIAESDLWVATGAQGVVIGALIVNEAPMPYIQPAPERELYIRLLVSDPAHRGERIGGRLIDKAKVIARRRGIGLLRVDCFAGGDGSLVRYYESQGFQPVAPFEVKGWPGMLLAQRVPSTDGAPIRNPD